MSNYFEACKNAVEQAKATPSGSMPEIAKKYWPAIQSNGKVKVCPHCGKKDKFGLHRANKSGGHWTWGCYYDKCDAHFDRVKERKHGDQLGLIQFYESVDYAEACQKLCEYSGVPFPDKSDYPVHKNNTPTEDKQNTTVNKTSPQPDESDSVEVISEEKSSLINIPEENRNPWEEIWTRLKLTNNHREELWNKRGLTYETSIELGFKSSLKENYQILDEVLTMFPEQVLIESGLAKVNKKTGHLQINSQLCGIGSYRNEDGKVAFKYTQPIIIPYIDGDGRITHLRPHKGGISPKEFIENSGYEESIKMWKSNMHPYCAALLNELEEDVTNEIVLTEGEFKAAALWQSGIPAIAVPGIYITRNEPFLKELTQMLWTNDVKKVTVIYDHEDKSHRVDIEKRFESEIFGKYACLILEKRGFWTKWGHLPDAWMDENKKADWDGKLADLAKKSDQTKILTLGNKEFKKPIRMAKRVEQQIELFSTTEKNRIVFTKLGILMHVPDIKRGGEDQAELAKAISKCHPDYVYDLDIWKLRSDLIESQKCYFVDRPPVKELRQFYQNKKKEIDSKIEEHSSTKEKSPYLSALAAVKLLLKGRPEIISDFTIKCEYDVRTRDGHLERLMTLKNRRGETSGLVQPDNATLSSGKKFMEFCLNTGHFNWAGRDQHLGQLVKDLSVYTAYKEIREINNLGYDNESNQYVMGDCSFTDKGEVLFPDKSDIIWNEAIGYRIDPEDLKHFAHQLAPVFWRNNKISKQEEHDRLVANIDAEADEIMSLTKGILGNFVNSFGDWSGYLTLAATLTYGFSPELVVKTHSQPGLWIHGKAGSGKTEIAKQIMQIWGFPAEYATTAMGSGTTSVALDRILSQYCSIPCHFDEFREDECDAQKLASIRNAYGRQSKQKGRLDQSKRTRSVQPLTMPIVTGEGATTDSATKGRFINITISSSKRIGTPAQQLETYQRMLDQANEYYRIGRFIMMHRKQFAKQAIEYLEEWSDDKKVNSRIKNARLVTNYGACFAALKSLLHLLNTNENESDAINRLMEKFKLWLMDYANTAAEEVVQSNFTIQFWDDVVACYRSDISNLKKYMIFGQCSFDENNQAKLYASGTTEDPENGIYNCVILNSKIVYSEYHKYLRQRGKDPKLARESIQSEVRKEPYWVQFKKRPGTHRMKLNEDTGRQVCWILRYDKMEESLQSIFQEFFEYIPPSD